MASGVVRMDIYRTALPMRRFEHAGASREMSQAVICRMKYADGLVGWGETLPREYVTGETLETVVDDLCDEIFPRCVRAGQVIPPTEPLPARDGKGRCINAAACAFDLAASRRLFDAQGHVAPAVLRELAGRVRPRQELDARVSGVLGSSDPVRTSKQLRKMRWFGLRDFKLKVGLGEAVDAENLRVADKQIGRAIRKGTCTLRVDVNGAWDRQTTPERVDALAEYGVCAVEQPVYCPAGAFLRLAERCRLPLIADETLLTEEDAVVLARRPEKVFWNIRLSKNGGLTGALRLARLAGERGVGFTIGCMVGESSLLSAAQRRLLQWGPLPRFVEGNYGRFLLGDDLTDKSLRFGYGGRLSPLRCAYLGVEIDEAKLARYATRVRTVYA